MRKRFLLIAMLLVVSLFVGMSVSTSVAIAADTPDNPTVKWEYVSAWAVNNPLYQYDLYMAKNVSAMTNGKFIINVHPAGEMVPSFETFDSVSSGAFQAGSTAPAFQSGLNSAFTLFSTMPLYFSQQDFMNWLYQVDGLKHFNEILEPYNIKMFPYSIFDVEAGFRSHKKLEKIEDYKGLKLRMGTPEGQEILRRIGASTMSISGGELYDAMQRRVIDGFEYMTPNVDFDMGFHEIAKYWAAPAWYQTSCVYYTFCNTDAWEKLPENYKVIFEVVAKACTLESSSYMNWQSAIGTKKFIDYGVEVTKADESLWKELAPVAKQVMEDFASKNPDYARILKAQMDYLEVYNLWRNIEAPFNSGFIIEELPEVKDEWLKKK